MVLGGLLDAIAHRLGLERGGLGYALWASRVLGVKLVVPYA